MKLHGFPEKLTEFLSSRRLLAHRWGVNDCVTCTADGVLAVTGYDFIAAWRGNLWTTEAEANAALEAAGGLIVGMDSHYARVMPSMAQRGDACLVKDAAGQPSLAFVVGSHAAAPGLDGLLLTPMDQARIAWRT